MSISPDEDPRIFRVSNCAVAPSGLHRIPSALPKSLLHPQDGPQSHPGSGQTPTVHLRDSGRLGVLEKSAPEPAQAAAHREM